MGRKKVRILTYELVHGVCHPIHHFSQVLTLLPIYIRLAQLLTLSSLAAHQVRRDHPIVIIALARLLLKQVVEFLLRSIPELDVIRDDQRIPGPVDGGD